MGVRVMARKRQDRCASKGEQLLNPRTFPSNPNDSHLVVEAPRNATTIIRAFAFLGADDLGPGIHGNCDCSATGPERE
jgi:hypothetical protein